MKTPNRISGRRNTANSPGFLALSLAALCLTVGTMPAGDQGEVKKVTKKEVKLEQKKNGGSEATVITGSLIPQKVKPNRIPVTSSPVIIISRQDIERSGEATLAGVLRKQISR